MNIMFGCAVLRAIERTDAELLAHMMNHPDIDGMTVGSHYAVSMAHQEEWIRAFCNNDREMRWMIQLSNKTVLGMISLTGIDWVNRNASVGIKTGPLAGERIRGDVQDAMYALGRYAFDELNLCRLETATLSHNLFSLKLSRGLGYQDEGVLRKKVFRRGKWRDVVIGSLLRDEFIRYEDGSAPWQKKRTLCGVKEARR